MNDKLTVADLAERLSLASEQSVSYHARQIRHWAQRGIFSDARIPPGAGPTASREFQPKHVGRAILLSALSAQGLNVDELAVAAVCMSNLAVSDAERLGVSYPAADAGLNAAIEAARRQEGGWFFVLYRKRNGEVGAGEFSTAPEISPILASAYPCVLALYVSDLLPCALVEGGE